MSSEGRRRIAVATKRSWAERRARSTSPKVAGKTKIHTAPKKRGGGMSLAARKRLSEMMKKRWAARRAKAS